MEDCDFYRVELDGQHIAVSYHELYALRKDILLYFDENLGESVYTLLPAGQFCLPYWQYLSFTTAEPWTTELKRYQKVVEEGCLALLHGIVLDLLEEPVNPIRKEWQQVSVEHILRYVNQYQPSSDRLSVAKYHLLRAFTFIQKLGPPDLDHNQMLRDYNLATAGKWFDEEIVQAYFRWNLAAYGSK